MTRLLQLALAAGMAVSLVPGPASAVESERTFYARRTSCNADQRLTVVRGRETAGCAFVVSLTPVAEETAPSLDYLAEDGVPFVLDATRPIKGVVSHVSYLQSGSAGVGAGLTTIDITVGASRATGAEEILGTTTVSYTATPAQYRYDVPFQFQPPAALNGTEFTGFRLNLLVRGRNLLHGFTRPNDTNVTVPITITA
ncbi:MAG TPA: hypothetical protein VG602_10280 [Actinomycetota bacterium]|nr:hypothetical protein [Actinomycetota bacterium]